MNTRAIRRASTLPVLALSFLLSVPAAAQTLGELERLIFEAVPLPWSGDPETPLHALAPRTSGTADAVVPLPPSRLQPASLAPPPLSADTTTAPLITDRRTAEVYEAEIEKLVTEAGPYTPDLGRELLALGELYQAQNEHERALEVFERAAQLARVNLGLNSLEQVPSVENAIESLAALGRGREAQEKHGYLVYLHEEYYGKDDPRVIPALLKLADWHMQAFQRNVRFEAQGMFIAHESGASTEKGVRRTAFRDLARAQGAYLQALRILVEGNHFKDPRLIDLERDLIEIYFLHAHRDSLLDNPENYLNAQRRSTGTLIRHRVDRSHSFAYRFGAEGYARIMAYQRHDPATTPVEHARTRMELGDWYLLFGRRTAAQQMYREAHDLLSSAGLSPEDIPELLRPAVPLTLPSFTPTAHTANMLRPQGGDVDWLGYIDLRFVINEFGKAREIRTLGKSTDTSAAVERRLTRLVRQSQFRPHFNSSGPGEAEVRLRYYYSY